MTPSPLTPMDDSVPSANTRRLSAWLLGVGAVVGVAWFAFQLSYPPLFRGLVCCDSTVYTTYARMLVRPIGDMRTLPAPEAEQRDRAAMPATTGTAAPRWMILVRTLFVSTGKYVPGYGFFLAAHILLSNATGGLLPWLETSLVTSLLLQTGALWFFWSSLNRGGIRTPAWALALALAHPLLATHAALPISDALAIALALAAFSLLLRLRFDRADRRNIFCSLAAGAAFGALVWTRSIYSVALEGLILCWLAWGAWRMLRVRNVAALALGAAALCGTVLVLLPRLIACHAAGGTVCVITPDDARTLTAELLGKGFTGARTYTVLRPIAPGAGTLVTVPDPFLQSFGCVFTPAAPTEQLAACVLRNWWRMPAFALVKAAGLLDAPHLSAYVTNITPHALRALLRATMLPVILGLLAAGLLFLLRRTTPPGWGLIGVFCAVYLCSLLPLAIEARYGLLFVPVGLLGLGHAWTARESFRSPGVQWLGVIMTALILGLFLVKTGQWDRADPIPYVPVSAAATSDILAEVMRTLPRAVTD